MASLGELSLIVKFTLHPGPATVLRTSSASPSIAGVPPEHQVVPCAFSFNISLPSVFSCEPCTVWGTHSNRRQLPGPNVSLCPGHSESQIKTRLQAATYDSQTQCELNELDHGIP